MAEQYSTSQVALDDFSLEGLQDKLQDVEDKELDSVTMTVGFNSPDSFTHKWTFEDVDSLEEYEDELKKTKDSAWRRLKKGWKGGDQTDQDFRSKVKNEIDIKIKDMPSEITEFKNEKKKQEALEKAVDKTITVYEKSGDESRNEEIGNVMTSKSNNVKEYLENMDEVEETLDFEDNVEGQWQEGRQRTTGDLTWYMEDGTEVFTQVNSNQVVHQLGGAGGRRLEFSKSQGKEFYEENKVV